MNQTEEKPSIFAEVLRSINGLTGALLGALAGIAFILSGIGADIIFGRPSPTQLAGTLIFGLVFLAGLWMVCGALAGLLVGLIVRHSRFSGPVSGRVVGAGVALAVLVPGFLGARSALEREANQAPRVIQTDGTIARVAGPSTLRPVVPAILAFDPLVDSPSRRSVPAESGEDLYWGSEPLGFGLEADTLFIELSGRDFQQVDLGSFDYVTQVQALTASLGDGDKKWLALLIRLRSTGRREIFLVFNPVGELVYQELLSRTRSGSGPVFWRAGGSGVKQELVLDLGEPFRYFLVH